ncbi:MAG: adaptor protein MecA [Clostridia bacterium]|nr:adaptor protein MecA [Clostridia bacterium]
MECLIINENKMKIMLDEKEVREYGIDCEGADYSDPKIRKAFWKILDKARDISGFKVSGEKMLIQYYPSKSGAEIFVTKLGKLSVGIEKNIAKSDSITMLSSKNMIYRFDDVDSIVKLYREIEKKIPDFCAEIYSLDGEEYYLFFEERCDSNSASQFLLVSEFGEEMPQNMESYIKEHGSRFSL